VDPNLAMPMWQSVYHLSNVVVAQQSALTDREEFAKYTSVKGNVDQEYQDQESRRSLGMLRPWARMTKSSQVTSSVSGTLLQVMHFSLFFFSFSYPYYNHTHFIMTSYNLPIPISHSLTACLHVQYSTC
jgi:hypothetical protein